MKKQAPPQKKKNAPAQPPAPITPKRAVSVCVCKNGQIIVRDALSGAAPVAALNIPLNLNNDPRLFLKNGELVRPFVTIHFTFQQQIEVSGIDMAFYAEASVAEFDPSALQPVGIRSLEQDFNELNPTAEQEGSDMAKVTVHTEPKQETPSQAIVKAGTAVQTVTDARGRAIGIRKMKPLDRLKMFEVIGSGNSDNQFYLGYASLAFHVTSIDGEAVNRPASKLQLEALVQRLDDQGMEAVASGIEEHFAPPSGQEADAREPIKNGSTTPS